NTNPRSDVYATVSGIASIGGESVTIQLNNGTNIVYLHVDALVANNTPVAAGQLIGRMANIPAPHVHLQSGGRNQQTHPSLILTLDPYIDTALPDILERKFYKNG